MIKLNKKLGIFVFTVLLALCMIVVSACSGDTGGNNDGNGNGNGSIIVDPGDGDALGDIVFGGAQDIHIAHSVQIYDFLEGVQVLSGNKVFVPEVDFGDVQFGTPGIYEFTYTYADKTQVQKCYIYGEPVITNTLPQQTLTYVQAYTMLVDGIAAQDSFGNNLDAVIVNQSDVYDVDGIVKYGEFTLSIMATDRVGQTVTIQKTVTIQTEAEHTPVLDGQYIYDVSEDFATFTMDSKGEPVTAISVYGILLPGDAMSFDDDSIILSGDFLFENFGITGDLNIKVCTPFGYATAQLSITDIEEPLISAIGIDNYVFKQGTRAMLPDITKLAPRQSFEVQRTLKLAADNTVIDIEDGNSFVANQTGVYTYEISVGRESVTERISLTLSVLSENDYACIIDPAQSTQFLGTALSPADSATIEYIDEEIGGLKGSYLIKSNGASNVNIGKVIIGTYSLENYTHFLMDVYLESAYTLYFCSGIMGSSVYPADVYSGTTHAPSQGYYRILELNGTPTVNQNTNATANLNRWITVEFFLLGTNRAQGFAVHHSNGEMYIRNLRLANEYYELSFATGENRTQIPSQSVRALGVPTPPIDPIDEYGDEFLGWFTDANFEHEFDFSAVIKANTTAYAMFRVTVNLPDFIYNFEDGFAGLDGYYSNGTLTYAEVTRQAQLLAKFVNGDNSFTQVAFNAAVNALKEGAYNLVITVEVGEFSITRSAQFYIITASTQILANSETPAVNFFKHATASTPVPVWTTEDVGGREGTYGVRVAIQDAVNVNHGIFPYILTYSQAQKNAIKYVSLDFYLKAPQVFAMLDGSTFTPANAGLTTSIADSYYAMPGYAKHYRMYDSITGEDLSNYSTNAAAANNVFLNRWVTLTFAVISSHSAYYGVCPTKINAGLEFDFYFSALRVTTTAATVTYMGYDGEQVLETVQVSGLVDDAHKYAGYLLAEDMIPDSYDGLHTFDKWYTDKALTTPFDLSMPILQDMVLYSSWQMPFALPNQLTYFEGDEANLSDYYTGGSPTLIEIKKGDTLYAKYIADDGTYTMAAFNAAFEALKEGAYSLTMTVVDDGIFAVTDYCTLYMFTEETTVLANSETPAVKFFKHATLNTPVPVWTTDDVGGREGTYGVRVTTPGTVTVNYAIFPQITTYSEAQKNAIKYISLDFYLLAPQVFALMDGSNLVPSAAGFTTGIVQSYYAQPGNAKHYKMYDSITGEDLTNFNTDAAIASNVFLNRWVTLTFAVTANSAASAYYGICPVRQSVGLEFDFYISALRVTTAAATVTYMDYDGEQVLETTQVSGLVDGTHKFAGYLIEEIIPENPDEALVFDGWYTDEELTVSFDFTRAVLGDTVLYSKWIPAA